MSQNSDVAETTGEEIRGRHEKKQMHNDWLSYTKVGRFRDEDTKIFAAKVYIVYFQGSWEHIQL